MKDIEDRSADASLEVPRSEWKWYGYAGHLSVASKCAYRLCTRVGGYLISTVGDYRPDGRARERIGGGEDSFFETYVFVCHGEAETGDPLNEFNEIDSERYARSFTAELGHYRFCEKYAALSQAPQGRSSNHSTKSGEEK